MLLRNNWTAKELQVKGLQSHQGEENYQKHTDRTNPVKLSETNYRKPEQLLQEESVLDSLEELAGNYASNKEEDKLVLSTNLEFNLQIEQMMEKNEGLWQCKVCGKTYNKYKRDIARHVETHIEGITYPCHICKKIFSTRHNVRQHIYKIHSESSFPCKACGKTGMKKGAFYNHNKFCNGLINQ